MSEEIYVEEIEGGLKILTPRNFDAMTAPHFRLVEETIVAKGMITHLLFDLEKTEFMDSAGVGFIVKLYKAARQEGVEVSIINASFQPATLLATLQIDRVIAVHKR